MVAQRSEVWAIEKNEMIKNEAIKIADNLKCFIIRRKDLDGNKKSQ